MTMVFERAMFRKYGDRSNFRNGGFNRIKNEITCSAKPMIINKVITEPRATYSASFSEDISSAANAFLGTNVTRTTVITVFFGGRPFLMTSFN